MESKRLDLLLVELGHAESRSKAQALIKAGNVLVDGKPAQKAGQSCTEDQKIEITGEYCPYVSRGGLKLEKRCATLAWILPALFAAIPAPPPAVLRIACCSREQRRSLPLM